MVYSIELKIQKGQQGAIFHPESSLLILGLESLPWPVSPFVSFTYPKRLVLGVTFSRKPSMTL